MYHHHIVCAMSTLAIILIQTNQSGNVWTRERKHRGGGGRISSSLCVSRVQITAHTPFYRLQAQHTFNWPLSSINWEQKPCQLFKVHTNLRSLSVSYSVSFVHGFIFFLFQCVCMCVFARGFFLFHLSPVSVVLSARFHFHDLSVKHFNVFHSGDP